MEDFWARQIKPSGQPGPNYWTFFAQRTADLATIPEGAAVLDIGTYDGNVLIKAMRQAGADGFGVGIDIYSGGFQEGIAEAKECELGNVVFAQMDAAHLGILPETYDSVLANFVGWDYCYDFYRMEYTAPESRMPEIMRVLKPGGQVGIGLWIEQTDIDWIVEAFRRYLPKHKEEIGDQMLSYGREDPKGYEVIFHDSGFDNINIHVETTTFVSPNTATWWRQMKQAANDYFKMMPELDQFKEQIFADLKEFQSPQGIHFDKTVAYAYGTKL